MLGDDSVYCFYHGSYVNNETLLKDILYKTISVSKYIEDVVRGSVFWSFIKKHVDNAMNKKDKHVTMKNC